jgi:hypothetical protein
MARLAACTRGCSPQLYLARSSKHSNRDQAQGSQDSLSPFNRCYRLFTRCFLAGGALVLSAVCPRACEPTHQPSHSTVLQCCSCSCCASCELLDAA